MTVQPLIAITADDLRAIVREEVEAVVRGHVVLPRPRWLTVRDAADALRVSVDTVRRRIEAGELKASGRGKLRRVMVETEGKLND